MVEQDRIHYNIKYYEMQPGLDLLRRGGFSRGGTRALPPAVTPSIGMNKM